MALGLRCSTPVEEVMCLIYSQICVSVLLIDTFVPTIAKKNSKYVEYRVYSLCSKSFLVTIILGTFKKRPNFLNSAPASPEFALRLLSTPSIRFWQQTAICPVLLWALLVELPPLNWTCVQAVHPISDNERAWRTCCVKVCCQLGKNFTETFQLLNQAYGEDCISQMQCYEWFKHFNEDRMSAGEDPRPGRPSTSTNDNHVERVRAVIRGNLRLTVREVADEVNISTGSCHPIFTQKLQMCRISAEFMQRLLTDDQKENCVEISHELLANANGNESFLKNIITGD